MGWGGGLLPGSTGSFPSESFRLPVSSLEGEGGGGGGGGVLLSGRSAAWKYGSTQWGELVAPTTTETLTH